MRKIKQVKRRWIFIPIEVKNRELLPKIFLGAKAIKAGFGIILGRNGMNVSRDHFPKGVYLDKCLSKHKIGSHEYQVNTLGNQLVSFDEEGLLFESEEKYVSNRLTQRSIDLSKLIFLWGKEQERVIRKHFSVEDKLVVSGGPRLDIWHSEFASLLYQSKIQELQHTYGKFILLASNWGYQPKDKENGLDPHKVYPGNLVSHIRSAFVVLITKLSSALPNQILIVRPHPIDIPEYWQTIAKTFPQNVKVIHEGPISPWIHAAHAVIHNDCTTGLEAWMGDVSTFAYYPAFQEFKEYHRYTMPINELGVVCRTADELIRKISLSFRNSNIDKTTTNSKIAQKFVHIEHNRYASDYIIEKLLELNTNEESYSIQSFNNLKKIRAFWISLKWRLRDFFGKSGMFTQSYTHLKNPGMTREEVENLLERLAPIVGVDESFFKIEEVDKDTFCIFGREELK